jgi:hypothetical protein
MHSPHFTQAEAANFLAAKAVAYATAFLDGRHGALELARHAAAVQLELMTLADPSTNIILDPVRLLNVAMMRTASAQGGVRQDRWRAVMTSLLDLVRHESIELRVSGAQRS